MSNKQSTQNIWVHLDFKGAPPSFNYLMRVTKTLKDWGVYGLLLEWEDMLPYTGLLECVRHPKCYSEKEVKEFLALCKELGLRTIPLVQTFGHLQHLLVHFPIYREKCDRCIKHGTEFNKVLTRFKQRRFSGRDGDIFFNTFEGCFTTVCPSNNNALDLVQELIKQTVQMHPDSDTIHLGFDEASFGSCNKCQSKSKVGTVLNYFGKLIRRYHSIKDAPTNVLVWNDMFNDWNKTDARHLLDLSENVNLEMMVWAYGPNIDRVMERSTAVRDVFKMWGASSFRAGMWHHDLIPPHQVHDSNIRAWKKIEDVQDLVLTGWAKSHSGRNLNCELLAPSLPTLHRCIEILTDCEQPLEFPGKELYFRMQALDEVRSDIKRLSKNDLASRKEVEKSVKQFREKLAQCRKGLVQLCIPLYRDLRDVMEIEEKITTLERRARWLLHHGAPTVLHAARTVTVDRVTGQPSTTEGAIVHDGTTFHSSKCVFHDGKELLFYIDKGQLCSQLGADGKIRTLIPISNLKHIIAYNRVVYAICGDHLYSWHIDQLKEAKPFDAKFFGFSSMNNVRCMTHDGRDSLIVICDDRLFRIPLGADGLIPTYPFFPRCVIGSSGWDSVRSIAATPDTLYAVVKGSLRAYPL